jgi:2-polyprenyl-6-hydroxyphenyl methylase/3-demethylubiquinone-9 3-methyltransferase
VELYDLTESIAVKQLFFGVALCQEPVTGKLGGHRDTLWHGGFVHFFTIRSISELLRQAGFENITAGRAGRIPLLAKTMVLSCTKPR